MIIRALHFLLLPIAATFGWYVGKRDSVASQASHQLRRDYFQGLSYLINEQSDQAVDVFIKLSEVDSDTAEIHLALGHLFRRRGEVDRAIRIHQNLLARPELDKHYHIQALFALGQDFLHAGVLDRAEQIFLELVEIKEGWGEEKQQSMRFLLHIYQQERDWPKAIAVTQKLSSDAGDAVGPLMAQFQCELAEQAASQQHNSDALRYLQQAINADPNCVRANLIAGRLARQAKRFREAILYYQQVKQQDIHYIPEIIAPLCECYRELGDETQLIEHLQECLQDYPNISLVLTVAEYLQRHQGDQAAIDFIAQQVKNEPSLHGLNRVAGLYLAHSADGAQQKLMMLQSIVQQFLADKPTYRCGHCGFSAKMLFWCCPSCHNWSSVRPIQSALAGVAV